MWRGDFVVGRMKRVFEAATPFHLFSCSTALVLYGTPSGWPASSEVGER